jgi:hypothetical protein
MNLLQAVISWSRLTIAFQMGTAIGCGVAQFLFLHASACRIQRACNPCLFDKAANCLNCLYNCASVDVNQRKTGQRSHKYLI